MQKSVRAETRSRPSALKVVTFVLAMIPLVALLAIVTNLVVRSVPAVRSQGLILFSATYDGQARFGLLPALWGTFLVALVAMIIGAPVSLMLAVIANDFSFRAISAAVRWTTGVLSGIPPIIYALMSFFFFRLFIWPKFAGQGLSDAKLPPPGMLPLDGSTLLGGILLALLIVPVMTPLMDDAIQNVPNWLKEASLSLGATRWHTLMKVTLPSGFVGITTALILGMLTAIGESMIVAYAIGFGVAHLPNPPFDILERVAPLTSTIASLSAGNFSRAEGSVIGQSVSAFIGLVLLATAVAFLGAATYLRRRFRKELSP